MHKLAVLQDQAISILDRTKLCSFDQEVIEHPTKSLIHQAARFLFINKGEGKIVINDVEYELHPHTWIAILPWEISTITEVTKTLQFYKIIYNFNAVNNALKTEYNSDNEYITLINSISNNPVIDLDYKEYANIKDKIENLKNEIGVESIYDTITPKSYSSVLVTANLIELLIYYYRYLVNSNPNNNLAEIKTDTNDNIFKYIYSHSSEKITLEKLSKVFYISESAVSKYIQEITGLTFPETLNQIRIGKAVDFLTHTDISISEIAELLGYVDAPHFCKTFLSEIGIQAAEYRKIYRHVDKVYVRKGKNMAYKVLDYIYEEYMKENFSIQDVSNKFDISTIDINRLLLFHVERNFDSLIHFLRVNKGCELLLSSDAAISDIAIEVGYNNSKTFSINFVKLKGMTPGSFRKAVLFQNAEGEIYSK